MFVALAALLAVEARVGDPLDTDALAKLDGAVGGVLANGNDLADTLVATDKGRYGLDGPVTERGVQVCVADTGAEHLEETFAGGEILGRLHGVVLDLDGGSGSRYDGDLLRRGKDKVRDGLGGHLVVVVVCRIGERDMGLYIERAAYDAGGYRSSDRVRTRDTLETLANVRSPKGLVCLHVTLIAPRPPIRPRFV